MEFIQTLSITFAVGIALFAIRKVIHDARKPEDYSRYAQATAEDLATVKKFIAADDTLKLNAIAVLIRDRKFIPAIKTVRILTGQDLKTAKETVEKISAGLRR